MSWYIVLSMMTRSRREGGHLKRFRRTEFVLKVSCAARMHNRTENRISRLFEVPESSSLQKASIEVNLGRAEVLRPACGALALC